MLRTGRQPQRTSPSSSTILTRVPRSSMALRPVYQLQFCRDNHCMAAPRLSRRTSTRKQVRSPAMYETNTMYLQYTLNCQEPRPCTGRQCRSVGTPFRARKIGQGAAFGFGSSGTPDPEIALPARRGHELLNPVHTCHAHVNSNQTWLERLPSRSSRLCDGSSVPRSGKAPGTVALALNPIVPMPQVCTQRSPTAGAAQ